jgi:hypothetical protein
MQYGLAGEILLTLAPRPVETQHRSTRSLSFFRSQYRSQKNPNRLLSAETGMRKNIDYLLVWPYNKIQVATSGYGKQ